MVSLALLTGPGCGGDDTPTGTGGNGNPGSIPPEIVATWHYQSVTVNGTPVSLALFLEWDQSTVRSTLTMNSNGSHRYSEWNASDQEMWWQSGTYAINGTNATFTAKANSDGVPEPPWSSPWAVNGNTLTFAWQDQGDNLVVKLTQSTPVVIPPEAVATWNYQSVTVNGASMSLGDVLEWGQSTTRAALTINANGSYRYSEWNATNQEVWWESGTIAFNGANITITPTANADGAPGASISGTGSINGGVLTVAVTILGDNVVFTLTS